MILEFINKTMGQSILYLILIVLPFLAYTKITIASPKELVNILGINILFNIRQTNRSKIFKIRIYQLRILNERKIIL